MNRGNILVLVLGGVALIAMAIASLFYYQNQLLQQSNTNLPAVQIPTKTDETANWKTYNGKFNNFIDEFYTFRYPSDWKFQAVGEGCGPVWTSAESDKVWLTVCNASILNDDTPEKMANRENGSGGQASSLISLTIDSHKAVRQEIDLNPGKEIAVYVGDVSVPVTTVPLDGQAEFRRIEIGTLPIHFYVRDVSKLDLLVKTFDQILSTFKFTSAGNTSNPNANVYTSQILGISFNYTNQLLNGSEKVLVKEAGSKIYVYPDSEKDYTQGQWVEVFPKDKTDSLADAVRKTILAGYSPNDCLVNVTTNYKNVYPSTYQIAEINVPSGPNDDLSTLSPKWAKCHEPYVSENGISYFLTDSNHSDKFIYLSIGQYAIESGISNKTWQETIKFL